MLKKCLGLVLATVFFTFHLFVNSASALELSKEVRTLPLNSQGETVVVTPEQYKQGQKVFVNTCSQCHLAGVTKTDPNVGLDPESLALATPARDNIEGLIDYLKNPTTYDGFTEISELHPSMKSADIFPEMRNLTEDDLFAVSSFVLIQPKVVGEQWGRGKTYRF